jgi:hypothetical protein
MDAHKFQLPKAEFGDQPEETDHEGVLNSGVKINDNESVPDDNAGILKK